MNRYEAFENVGGEWVILDGKTGKTLSWTGIYPLTFDSEIEAKNFIKEEV